jgi:hypothetical protein
VFGAKFPSLGNKNKLHTWIFFLQKISATVARFCVFFPNPLNFHIYTIDCSQIWLSSLVDDSQLTNLTDFQKKNKKTKKPLVQTNCQNIVGFFI